MKKQNKKTVVTEVETAAKLRGHGMRVKAPRMVYFVDATAFVEEENSYRVSIVVEGENGHRPTGDDDYATNVRARRPYFWGPTLANAEQAAKDQNEKMGVSEKDAFDIVTASMFPRGAVTKRMRKAK